MELSVHGKQIDVGDSLRGHVKEKIEDLSSKYFNHTTFANITFSKEGHGHPRTRAHISIKLGKNLMVVADAIEADPYVAFDSAAEKAGKQLRRYKRRLRDHNERDDAAEAGPLAARDVVLSGEGKDDAPEAPVVIAEMTTNIETLTVSDAVMRMDLADLPALMFHNASSNSMNMVYRRPDGNVGWVDPGNCEAAQKMNGKTKK
jgi:ribosomal subunit interface protein